MLQANAALKKDLFVEILKYKEFGKWAKEKKTIKIRKWVVKENKEKKK